MTVNETINALLDGKRLILKQPPLPSIILRLDKEDKTFYSRTIHVPYEEECSLNLGGDDVVYDDTRYEIYDNPDLTDAERNFMKEYLQRFNISAESIMKVAVNKWEFSFRIKDHDGRDHLLPPMNIEQFVEMEFGIDYTMEELGL